MPLPGGSGQFVPAGSAIILQLHYVAAGYPADDEPKLALYFHEQPPKSEYMVASAFNEEIHISPYAAHHIERAETTVPEDADLCGLAPHMHYRGSEFRYIAHYPDGHEETLLSVPNYNFNWQTLYQLKEPKRLPAGTKILVDAVFDNSTQNPLNPNPAQDVRWGTRSEDEMLIGYYMYTRPTEAANERRLNRPLECAMSAGMAERACTPEVVNQDPLKGLAKQ
jgi:hypothetical protein